jgi:hypothetical protein
MLAGRPRPSRRPEPSEGPAPCCSIRTGPHTCSIRTTATRNCGTCTDARTPRSPGVHASFALPRSPTGVGLKGTHQPGRCSPAAGLLGYLRSESFDEPLGPDGEPPTLPEPWRSRSPVLFRPPPPTLPEPWRSRSPVLFRPPPPTLPGPWRSRSPVLSRGPPTFPGPWQSTVGQRRSSPLASASVSGHPSWISSRLHRNSGLQDRFCSRTRDSLTCVGPMERDLGDHPATPGAAFQTRVVPRSPFGNGRGAFTLAST